MLWRVSCDCRLLALSDPQSPIPFRFFSLSCSYTSVKIMVSCCRLVIALYCISYTSAICPRLVSYTGWTLFTWSVCICSTATGLVAAACHDQWMYAMCWLEHDCWCDLLDLFVIYFTHAMHTDSRQAHLVTHKSMRSNRWLCVHHWFIYI